MIRCCVVALDAGACDDGWTMHDNTSRPRPELVQTPDPTAVQTTIPIAEAAARLGISADAVRKRIQRGKLTGHKTDSGWTVDWIEPDSGPEVVQTASSDLSAVVARLESENAYLRQTLDAEIEARRRADHLVAGLMERLPELVAGGSTSQEAPVDATKAPVGDVAPVGAPALIERVRRLLGRL